MKTRILGLLLILAGLMPGMASAATAVPTYGIKPNGHLVSAGGLDIGPSICMDANGNTQPCLASGGVVVATTNTFTPTQTPTSTLTSTPITNTLTPTPTFTQTYTSTVTSTHTPGHVVIDTPTFTFTWTPGGNTATPTMTLTPETVVIATVSGTRTPLIVFSAQDCVMANGATCTPSFTATPQGTPAPVNDTAGTAAINYQVSAIPTPKPAGYATTAVPTASAEGAAVSPSFDLRGIQRNLLYTNGGALISTLGSNADGTATTVASTLFAVVNEPLNYNGATWDRTRLATTYNCLTITASGSTAIIGANTNGGNSPLIAGNKWRLMGYKFSITGDVTDASGDVYIKFVDNATTIGISETFDTPTSALTNSFGLVGPWISLGNGIASAAANNALNVNLSSALATGVCTVCVGFVQGTTP